MSTFFDKDFGVIPYGLYEIVELKKQWLKDNHNITMSSDANIYHIIASSLAILEVELVEKLNKFFKTTGDINGGFFKEIQNYLSIQSTTFEAVRNRLLKVEDVMNANIVSTAGKVHIYLIVFKALLKENLTELIDTAQNDQEQEALLRVSKFKNDVWQAIYDSAPVGTHYDGAITIDGRNLHNQLREYKFSIGKVRYGYIKVSYKIDLKNNLYLNIDSRIREIFQRIINNNYGAMGIDFEHMDFHAPVNEIKGIHFIKVSIAIEDDDSKEIKDITSGFKENENVKIEENELLDLSTCPGRLAIAIES